MHRNLQACLICQAELKYGRADRLTCTARCRKRLERLLAIEHRKRTKLLTVTPDDGLLHRKRDNAAKVTPKRSPKRDTKQKGK